MRKKKGEPNLSLRADEGLSEVFSVPFFFCDVWYREEDPPKPGDNSSSSKNSKRLARISSLSGKKFFEAKKGGKKKALEIRMF